MIAGGWAVSFDSDDVSGGEIVKNFDNTVSSGVVLTRVHLCCISGSRATLWDGTEKRITGRPPLPLIADASNTPTSILVEDLCFSAGLICNDGTGILIDGTAAGQVSGVICGYDTMRDITA